MSLIAKNNCQVKAQIGEMMLHFIFEAGCRPVRQVQQIRRSRYLGDQPCSSQPFDHDSTKGRKEVRINNYTIKGLLPMKPQGCRECKSNAPQPSAGAFDGVQEPMIGKMPGTVLREASRAKSFFHLPRLCKPDRLNDVALKLARQQIKSILLAIRWRRDSRAVDVEDTRSR